MVCAVFIEKLKTDIVFISDRIHSVKYQNVLDEHFLSFITIKGVSYIISLSY